MAKNFKKFFILPLVAALAVCLMAINVKTPLSAEKISGSSSTDLTSTKFENFDMDSLISKMMKDSFANLGLPTADDEVWAIVQLETSSLLDYAKEANYQGSLNQYLNTSAAQANMHTILEEQEVVKTRINNALDVEFKYAYTTIANGFAVKVKYGDINKLSNIKGVSNVVLSVDYETPKSEATATNVVADLATLAGAKTTSDYKGEGMVIGVIDTGLQANHEAFSVAPSVQRFTANEITAALTDTAAYALSGGALTVTGTAASRYVYKSAKVPFAYDYADLDADVSPTSSSVNNYGNDHGTHVAGIVAGNNGRGFEGAAPEAQLAIFKVFSNYSSGASSVDIIAALNDAVVLGVDVINMSLGSTCGFSVHQGGETYQEFYDAVFDAGISLCVAAGNDYMSSLGTDHTYGTVLTVDQGNVSSPSTLPQAFSVASYDTENETAAAIRLGGVACIYNDCVIDQNTSERTDFVELVAGSNESVSYPYVFCGLGTKAECQAAGVNGKIALIQRGDITFTEKAQGAKDAGAIAVIIYNNVAGSRFNPVVEGVDIPVCSISLEDGLKAREAENKVCEVGKGVYIYGGTLSDFSSWGPSPSLGLKPEITTYGGSVYSSLPAFSTTTLEDGSKVYSNYGLMSGTSMASPNMAANIAITRQYLQSKYYGYGLTAKEISDQAYQLIMSTATPLVNRDNAVYYSPRRQGAGLINIDNALNTPAYLHVHGQQKTKIELGDDPDRLGVYNLTFVLTNMTSLPLSYNINPILLQTRVSETGDDENFGLEGAMNLITDSVVSYSIAGKGLLEGNKVTVEGNGDVAISVKIRLSDETKASIDKIYPYGTYVEGFVELEALGENDIDLSIPYLGFYGDWDKLPLFDSTVYDDEAALGYDTTLVSQAYNGRYRFPMGTYLYNVPEGVVEPAVSQDHNALSPRNSSAVYGLYSVFMGMLRSAARLNYDLYDANTGELLESVYANYVGKATYDFDQQGYAPVAHPLFNFFEFGYANNSHLKLVITALTDTENPYENDNYQYEFDIYIDSEAPVIIGVDDTAREEATGGFSFIEKDGHKYLVFDVQDNHALQSYTIMTSSQSILSMMPFYSEIGERVHLEIDITPYERYLTDNKIIVLVDDYALNSTGYVINLPAREGMLASFGSASYEVEVGSTVTPSISVYPVGSYADTSTLKFTSSNPSVATVSASGVITGVSVGEATITASFKTLNDKELTCTTQVVVKEKTVIVNPPVDKEVESIELSATANVLKVGELFQLSATVSPSDAVNSEVTWLSSDESVATVEDGKVTATGVGVAVISASTANGVNASCVVYVADENGFVISDNTFVAYFGEEKTVIIPEGVTAIADYAFAGNDYIVYVEFSSTVKTIGVGAFQECTDLERVALNSGVTSIPADCFRGSGILEFIAGTSVSRIGSYAFAECPRLEKFEFAEGNTNAKIFVGEGALSGSAVREIDWTKVNVVLSKSSSLTTSNLSKYVFEECANLTSVKLGNSVTVIPQETFAFCTSLEEFVISNNVTKIDNYAFAYSGITSFTAPQKLATLGTFVFRNCASLVTANLGNVKTIPNGSFYQCTSLASFTVNEGVTTIGNNAFMLCTSLATLTLPSTFVKGGNNMFAGCEALTRINLNAIKEVTWQNDLDYPAFIGVPSAEIVAPANGYYASSNDGILYTKGYKEVVLVFDEPSAFATGVYKMRDEVEYLPEYVFAGCTFNKVILGASLKEIGDYAFALCENLEEVVWNSGLQYIGVQAFAFAGLTGEIELPDSISFIDQGAFRSNVNLTKVTLPAGLQEFFAYTSYKVDLPYGVFEGCENLVALEISESNGKFKTVDGVLYTKDGTTLYIYPEGKEDSEYQVLSGTVAIKMNAFINNTYLSKVILPSTLKTIGDSAFYGCTSLTNVQFLGAIAPALEESIVLVSGGQILVNGYSNFVDRIFYMVTIGGQNYVGYAPIEGLTIEIPADSRGYDQWSYSMIFQNVVESPLEAILDVENVELSEVTTKGINVSWSGNNLGAKFYVYRSLAGGEKELAGVSETCEFFDSKALALGLTYDYEVVAVYEGASGIYAGSAATASITTTVPADKQYIADFIKMIYEYSTPNASNAAMLIQVYGSYQALSDLEKAQIGVGYLLVNAYNVYSAAAQFNNAVLTGEHSTSVIEAKKQIRELKEVYANLSEESKVYVNSLEAFAEWEVEVNQVADFIMKLTKLSVITEESGALINEINEEYASYSNYQKAMVGTRYSEAISVAETKYLAICEAKIQSHVKAVTDIINQLPNSLTSADKELVNAARKAYDSLSDAEKALVDASVVEKLVNAEAKVKDVKGCTVSIGAVLVSALTALSLSALVFKKRG